MYLQQFDFEIIHRLGKENTNADVLSQTPERMCYFAEVEIEEEEGTPTFLNSENELTNYEGDSEDNANNELLREETRTSGRKCHFEIKNTRSDDESASQKEEEAIIAKSPIAYSCCKEIWCNCTMNNPFEYLDNKDQVAQEDESYYSPKHAEEIISYYEDDSVENENSWEPEYYNNDKWLNPVDESLNGKWGLPDLSDEIEKHIDKIWEF